MTPGNGHLIPKGILIHRLRTAALEWHSFGGERVWISDVILLNTRVCVCCVCACVCARTRAHVHVLTHVFPHSPSGDTSGSFVMWGPKDLYLALQSAFSLASDFLFSRFVIFPSHVFLRYGAHQLAWLFHLKSWTYRSTFDVLLLIWSYFSCPICFKCVYNFLLGAHLPCISYFPSQASQLGSHRPLCFEAGGIV